jgi:hypothetical protein
VAFVLLIGALVALWAALKTQVLRSHRGEGGEAALPRTPALLHRLAARPGGVAGLWALFLLLAAGAVLTWTL